MGIDSSTIQAAKEGKSTDARTQAALSFAKTLVAKKGKANDNDIDALKNAGFDEAAIAEIIAHTALNIFTNYFNNTLSIVVDFPKVELVEMAAI